MKAVVQRVKKASVKIDSKTIASINKGFLVLVGIYSNDSEVDVLKIAKKILNLRIFNNNEHKINLNISNIKGKILLVSQFTLCADTKKGNRPSFKKAMEPDKAQYLFNSLKNELSAYITTQSGKFGASMNVELINDGPMTIILDTNEQ